MLISEIQTFKNVDGGSGDETPTLSVPKTHFHRVEYDRQLSDDSREHTDVLKQAGGYTIAYLAHRRSDDDDSYCIDSYDDEKGTIPL